MNNHHDLEEMLSEMDTKMAQLEIEMTQMEKEGIKNTVKYFDRIHDKLFSFNNMLIAAYFVIIAFPNSTVSPWLIAVPVINMLYLIFIEYRMLLRSRFQSVIKSKGIEEISKDSEKMSKTNRYSLQAISITLVVTVIFIYQIVNLKDYLL